MGTQRKKKIYSKEFKLQVVLRVLEEGHGIRETAREFQIAHCMVQRWIHIYLEHGEAALKDARATRRYEGEDMPPLGRRKRKPKPNAKGYIESELPEAVRNELRHLRMENAYLKKVSALVQKRERQPLRKKQRLSSD